MPSDYDRCFYVFTMPRSRTESESWPCYKSRGHHRERGDRKMGHPFTGPPASDGEFDLIVYLRQKGIKLHDSVVAEITQRFTQPPAPELARLREALVTCEFALTAVVYGVLSHPDPAQASGANTKDIDELSRGALDATRAALAPEGDVDKAF